MIYILEMYNEKTAPCGQLSDWDEVYERYKKTDLTGGIWEQHIVGQYQEMSEPELRAYYPGLPEKLSPDLMFWTARFLLGENKISLTPISKKDACIAYAKQKFPDWLYFEGEEEAFEAAENDELWKGPLREKARRQLRSALAHRYDVAVGYFK